MILVYVLTRAHPDYLESELLFCVKLARLTCFTYGQRVHNLCIASLVGLNKLTSQSVSLPGTEALREIAVKQE